MALRVRKDGRILCAKFNKAEEGDIYIDDSVHEWLVGSLDISLFKNEDWDYNLKNHEWIFIGGK